MFSRRRVRRRQIVAQALEHGLAQEAVIGDAAVLDLGEDIAPDPSGFRFLDRDGERRAFDDQWVEPLAHLARRRQGVAGARLTGVDEAITLAAAEVERGDAPGSCAELLHERHDGKGVALGAFELDPAFLPSGAVGRVAQLGHDAFQPELAGMAIDGLAVLLFEELGEGNRFRSLGKHAPQRGLARHQGRAAQVVSVEIKQVEGMIDETVGVLFRELAPELLKVRQAGVAQYGGFPVDDQVVRRQCLRRLRDLVELLRPVIAAAGIDADPAVANVQLRAIAVDLDFMQPFGALGRLLAQRRVAWLDECGKGRRLGAWNGRRGMPPGYSAQRDCAHAG
jgi:hypothetical protein